MLRCLSLLQQAAIGNCLPFDPFPFDQDNLASPKVDVGGRQVACALMVSQMIDRRRGPWIGLRNRERLDFYLSKLAAVEFQKKNLRNTAVPDWASNSSVASNKGMAGFAFAMQALGLSIARRKSLTESPWL